MFIEIEEPPAPEREEGEEDAANVKNDENETPKQENEARQGNRRKFEGLYIPPPPPIAGSKGIATRTRSSKRKCDLPEDVSPHHLTPPKLERQYAVPLEFVRRMRSSSRQAEVSVTNLCSSDDESAIDIENCVAPGSPPRAEQRESHVDIALEESEAEDAPNAVE